MKLTMTIKTPYQNLFFKLRSFFKKTKKERKKIRVFLAMKTVRAIIKCMTSLTATIYWFSKKIAYNFKSVYC